MGDAGNPPEGFSFSPCWTAGGHGRTDDREAMPPRVRRQLRVSGQEADRGRARPDAGDEVHLPRLRARLEGDGTRRSAKGTAAGTLALLLGPATGFFERLAGLQHALEAG